MVDAVSSAYFGVIILDSLVRFPDTIEQGFVTQPFGQQSVKMRELPPFISSHLAEVEDIYSEINSTCEFVPNKWCYDMYHPIHNGVNSFQALNYAFSRRPHLESDRWRFFCVIGRFDCSWW